jgi:hypothetical protein
MQPKKKRVSMADWQLGVFWIQRLTLKKKKG